MLLGIDPCISPDLLATLSAMGHGDEIAIVDANFPAAAIARRLCRADGVEATRMLEAILSLLPLDDFEPCAAWRMGVVDEPSDMPAICTVFAKTLAGHAYTGPFNMLERHAFYARARDAYAVVATGEHGLYGNIILRKGVVRP